MIPRVLGGILRATQGRGSGLHLPGKILRPSWGRCPALWALKLSEQQRPDLGGRAMSCQRSCLLCFCWTFRALLLLDSLWTAPPTPPHRGGCDIRCLLSLSLKLPLIGAVFAHPDFGSASSCPGPSLILSFTVTLTLLERHEISTSF